MEIEIQDNKFPIVGDILVYDGKKLRPWYSMPEQIFYMVLAWEAAGKPIISNDDIKHKNLAYRFRHLEFVLKYIDERHPKVLNDLRSGTADSDINAWGSPLQFLKTIKDEFYNMHSQLSNRESDNG